MYEADSFYTLSGAGQIGLLAVSLGFATGMGWLVRRISRRRTLLVRVGIWALLLYLFIWLSPQGYYAYYQLIFDGLPSQWVIGRPIPLIEAVQCFTFTGPYTLSAHSLGALGWILLILTLWPQRSNCRDAAN